MSYPLGILGSMCDRLSELREAMGLYALGFDADSLSVADAGRALEEATVIKNMATTVAALAAARVVSLRATW